MNEIFFIIFCLQAYKSGHSVWNFFLKFCKVERLHGESGKQKNRKNEITDGHKRIDTG